MHARLLVVLLALLVATVAPAAATVAEPASVSTPTSPGASTVAAGPHAETAGPSTAAGGTGPASGDATGAAAQACSFPVTMTDATGTEVTVPARPERIAVLGPSAAQTLWEIGAKDRVVAAPHRYAGYLDGIEETVDLTGAGQSYVANEKVVNASPDLVLAPNIVAVDTVEKLREAGLTVYYFPLATSIEDVYAKTNRTGRLVGACDGAAETVAWMQRRIGAIREAVGDEPRPGVLVSMGGGFTAGKGTFLHDVVTAAGVTNVAAAANVTGYAEISGETVVQQDPAWIIRNGRFGTYPKTPAYNGTTAVREGQVFTVAAKYASQPAPRLVYAIENVTQRIHPEAYEEAMAALESDATTTDVSTTETTEDSTPTETTGDETTGDETTAGETTAAETTADEATASGGQPGFGVGAAAVAMLGAALLLLRRD